MQQKKFSGYIVGGAILLVLLTWIITSYNSLVKKQEKVKLQWSEVQNTYQRRLDLIPNLVNVVKGVSDFEQTTLEKITEARSRAITGLSNNELTAENYQQQSRLQDTLAAAANRLIIQIERYPALKGTAAYAGLQTQLEGTERRIRVARNDFNETVADYNKKVRGFPSNLVAGIFGFKRKEGFEAVSGTEKAIEIKF
ncbi:MAG TPA: LemA family protein [Chitinophagaceae bacterium]|nr:LemA family protein [Chitinophagaceae bacterium]